MTTAFERSEKTGRERSESEGRHSAGGRSVTIINITRRMKVYNLPHGTYCKALGKCACKTLNGKKVCSSLTFPAGGFKKGLPDALFEVADILRDVETGVLRAHRDSNKKAAGTKKPTSSDTSTQAQGQSKSKNAKGVTNE